jgi:hypothetical protein
MIVHHVILGSVQIEVQLVERFDEGTLVDSYKQNLRYLAPHNHTHGLWDPSGTMNEIGYSNCTIGTCTRRHSMVVRGHHALYKSLDSAEDRAGT